MTTRLGFDRMSRNARSSRHGWSRRLWSVLVGVLLLVYSADVGLNDGMKSRLSRKGVIAGIPVALVLIYSGLRR